MIESPTVGLSSYHHASHRHLLAEAQDITPQPVDAIIVPTARTVAYLRTAVELAQHHGCVLFALCSGRASATKTIRLAYRYGVEVVAVDMRDLRSGLVPEFATSTMLDSANYGRLFARNTDTSLKRNIGLLFAHIAGWDRVVFLDDDITIPQPDDLNNAVGLLDRHAGAGLSIGGFPDNSVVCHAYRDAGGEQDTFIGGGALAVGRSAFDSFFPDIYNEDWFFLLNETGLRPSAITGRGIQAPYDPYRDTMRARGEELGDCLAEGLFSLLDTGMRLTDADSRFWADFLGRRRSFIHEVIQMVSDTLPESAEKARMTAALEAAVVRNRLILPEMCVDYMEAWRADRKLWERHIQAQRPVRLHKLLARLGLMHCYREGF
ncbi:hypothetical protein JOF56_006082 [Kibdelosporangium banguiense]|uniref:Glycosyl transferase family 2 n=1 Tax=Kibdelosporangium banguiense TaxID=1365924 RepID=A0ABS4TMR1_9PSEU|nr:hypothetical protein [Kibdelosporangium banguiense]MBP2325697.1 hypothetical protein [Kibdelosporangium banguiense]